MQDILDLIVMGIGAGAKGTIAGYVSKFVPELGTDIAALIAGGAMYYFGGRIHPLVKKFGTGVLIAGIGQLAGDLLAGLAGGGHHHRSPQRSPSPQVNLKSLAEAEARKKAVFS